MVVGALAGLATLPARRHGADAGFEAVAHCALFGLATAGLALLPDSDHHDASFAHAAGPLSWVIAHVVGLLFGGHRYGMHSIPGTALVAALATGDSSASRYLHALHASMLSFDARLRDGLAEGLPLMLDETLPAETRTLAAIGAVLLKLGATAILALCALGAGFALICTVIYVRQGLALLKQSGHTTAPAAKQK